MKDIIFFKGAAFLGIIALFGLKAFGQSVVLNEVQTSNLSTIYDHTGEAPDWIEIYNAASNSISLQNYSLSDDKNELKKWQFPSVSIDPGKHILVFASGLNLKNPPLYWETIIDKGATWKYLIPKSNPDRSWALSYYNDSGWLSGKSGFGFGDNDDSTIIESTISVFLRKKFNVEKPETVRQAWLHIDYDDGFVAYINGKEIARSNMTSSGMMPPFNEPAKANHEAAIYQGNAPEAFLVDSVFKYLQPGENVLSIQVHNQSASSSDLTAIPFFSLGYSEAQPRQLMVSTYFDLKPIGLHTNFKIDADEDTIFLSNANGKVIDSVFTIIPGNYSYGRKTDGNSSWGFFIEPTPSKTNNTKSYSSTDVGEVIFSTKGGYCTKPISLQLSSLNDGDSIFYTLNGSEPTNTSLLYTTAVGISKNTTIRARIIKSEFLPGSISTQAYLFGSKHDLPIVSITTDPANLWDEDYGIYVKGKNASSDFPFFGANFWEDWERPANLTLYEPDGSTAFQIDGGIKIFGAYSRGNDQKSLAFHTRKSYGEDKIEYKVFSDLDLDEFKSLVLRNSGNDFNNTMLRDGYLNMIVRSLDLDQVAYRPAVVYINGEYWGIQNIREKVNEDFLASHHGVDPTNLDVLELEGLPISGTGDNYAAMIDFIGKNNMASVSNYAQVKTMMDVDNFIKYQIAEIFIDNTDWPGNNIKFWRERNAAGKWRWILFDTDFGFNIWAKDRQYFNTLEFALNPNGPGWPNPPWSTLLFRKLMENASFKNDFINGFADNLNTIFQPSVLTKTLDKLNATIESEIPRHMQRWNGSMDYRHERIAAMRDFARVRADVVRTHIKNQFFLTGIYSIKLSVLGQGTVKVNTIVPVLLPWTGTYFNNVPINIRALPAPGFRFVRWEGVDQPEGELLPLSPMANLQITAVFEPTQIDESSVVINEINYSSSDDNNTGDWVELLNTSSSDINISGWHLKDGGDNEYTFPLGSIIERNGFLVISRNKRDFSVHFPEVSVMEEELPFGLGNDGDCLFLRASDNKLIDEVCYTNYSPWPPVANGGGSTLALINAYEDNTNPANWEASEYYGTPGARNSTITSVEENSLHEFAQINLYPNPAKDHIILDLYAEDKEVISVKITDMAGRQKLLLDNYIAYSGPNKLSLPLGMNQPGMYVITVCKGSNVSYKKIVINL